MEAGIKFGYAANQIGFGWTNAAYLDLLAGLESKVRKPAASRAYPFAGSLAERVPSTPLAASVRDTMAPPCNCDRDTRDVRAVLTGTAPLRAHTRTGRGVPSHRAAP